MASSKELFSERWPILARWVAVMRYRLDNRQMTPSPWQTRCVRSGEIHEFIMCDESEFAGGKIDRVAYLGFAEMASPGVIAVGDGLYSSGKPVGVIRGFDETHFPNHYNILLSGGPLESGEEIGLELGGSIGIRGPR